MEEPVAIASISSQHFDSILRRFSGYAKSCSLTWLRMLGVSTLDGLIVDSWNARAEECARAFANRMLVEALLLRIDRKAQRWTSRRGGYLIEVASLPALHSELAREGFISILLEPASPLSNRCALSGLLLEHERRLIIEAVGQGFDASDILRSDIGPHERWEAPLMREGDGLRLAAPVRRSFLVTQEQFADTKRKRLAKIGARIIDPAFPETVMKRVPLERLRSHALGFLEKTGERALLESNTYKPIPAAAIREFAGEALQIKNGMQARTSDVGSVSLSASVIEDGRMVFWDFFPVNQQEMHLLWCYNQKGP